MTPDDHADSRFHIAPSEIVLSQGFGPSEGSFELKSQSQARGEWERPAQFPEQLVLLLSCSIIFRLKLGQQPAAEKRRIIRLEPRAIACLVVQRGVLRLL